MNYSEQLKDRRWLSRRVDILKRDKHRCVICGYFGPKVNVHHLKYTGYAWDAPDEDLITLYCGCHRTTHMPEIRDRQLGAMRLGVLVNKILKNG